MIGNLFFIETIAKTNLEENYLNIGYPQNFVGNPPAAPIPPCI